MTIITVPPVNRPISYYETVVRVIIKEALDEASGLKLDDKIIVVREYDNPAQWHQMIAMMLTIATFQHNNLRYISSCIDKHTFQVV